MKTAIKAAIALPITLTLTALAATPSRAGSLTYATQVDSYIPGSGITEAYRKNTAGALGAPQLSYDSNKDFLSLGRGGEAIFSFGTLFGGKVSLWETTWGKKSSQSDYDERVAVFVGNLLNGKESDWLRIGEIWNIRDNAYRSATGASLSIGNNNAYQYLKVVDLTPRGNSDDGFDVNAVAVEAIPEPLTMSGLALGISGIMMARRRRVSKA
ncbi:MAG: PEP-CTERM sorting domain-containing protein [Actinomycetota bacterium]